MNYCHSDEGSGVDTESRRVYKVKNEFTKELETHPLRVWHAVGRDERYKSFAESSAYEKFQKNNENKTISRTVFSATVCKCVRDPSPQPCVDLLRSGLKEYMIAIKNAIDQRPAIRNRLANCTCERHTRRRNESLFERDDNITDGLVMWEDIHFWEHNQHDSSNDLHSKRGANKMP